MRANALDRSTILQRARSVSAGLERAASESWTQSSCRGGVDRLKHLVADSKVVAVSHSIGETMRRSWIYRWFTSEPDPEVVVIDLREVRTVAPFLFALDWIVRMLRSAWDSSLFKQAGEGLEAGFRSSALANSDFVASTISLVIALLEPPEVSDKKRHDTRSASSRSSATDGRSNSPDDCQ